MSGMNGFGSSAPWSRPEPSRSNNDVRIGDQEREQAISHLGAHYAAGRLSLTEYEQRSGQAAAAVMRSDLVDLFTDLPVLPPSSPQAPGAGGPVPPAAAMQPPVNYGKAVTMYSSSEVEKAAHQAGRPKAAIMWLTGLGAFTGGIVLNPMWSSSAVLLFLIPAVYALLYVAKIGPASWHQPSVRELERQRQRELRTFYALEAERQRAIRKQRQAELGTAAVDYANQFLQRRRPH
ncbi:hypothetical protein CWC39_01285 [Corynebacterium heidelbergense]|uniref:DUF1707 domain-containing protein n=2 Tax=Corynebacterium heidelbergense TaxID=2055947 RepID=A0A364VDS6_9CORY|nr:hypothetical protein CWC39_01285 [Corynebacterium heidelbergense]